jgi:hypothetical protein
VDSGASPWQTIKPNTAADASATFACALGRSPAPSLAARTLSLDGRSYGELSSTDVYRFTGLARSAKAEQISSSRLVVQVGAAPSRGAADVALDRVRRKTPSLVVGLETGVETATVGGRLVYRAVLYGFQADQDAKTTCNRLRKAGIVCLVRPRG